MGNGPSLNKMDLDLFKQEVVFASNAIYLLFDRIRWRPRYYSCVDSRVLPDIASQITGMLHQHPDIEGFFPRFLRLYDGSDSTIDSASLVAGLPNAHFFDQRGKDLHNLPESAFTLGLGAPLCTPNTVTITLMQIATLMGFTEIFLFGCDMAYTIPPSVLQEGSRVHGSSEERLLLTSTADDDPNHFSPDYFGAGRRWHHPKTDQMLEHYYHAKQVLDSAGVAVYNATVGGNLEVFERVDYRDVLTAR